MTSAGPSVSCGGRNEARILSRRVICTCLIMFVLVRDGRSGIAFCDRQPAASMSTVLCCAVVYCTHHSFATVNHHCGTLLDNGRSADLQQISFTGAGPCTRSDAFCTSGSSPQNSVRGHTYGRRRTSCTSVSCTTSSGLYANGHPNC